MYGKTYSAKPADIEKKWVLIDASGLVVGTLATMVVALELGRAFGMPRAVEAALGLKTATAPVAGTDIVKQDNTKWGSGTANIGFDPYTPTSTGWNGGLYIEVSNASTTNQTAVILANGQVATGSSLTPTGSSAPTGRVSPGCATSRIVASRPYGTCPRGRG